MAELITFLIALPLLYGIGLFYGRLGLWLYQVARQAVAASRRAGSP